MTERKWTPGPWMPTNNPGDWGLGGAWAIAPSDANPYDWDQCISHVEYVTPYCAGASRAEIDAADRAAANAHLIAAAPDLYESLEAAMDYYEHNGITGGGVEATRAALSKARGETQ